MRVRVRYAKSGKLRFVSAIDLGRIWERSLRRADLPIAYSEGFSPHPRVSFPDALTLGYASTGEYAELTFAGRIALDRAVTALNAAFPEGMRIIAAVEVEQDAPRLSKWLQASMWDLSYPAAGRIHVAALLAADRLPVDRDRKGEVTRVDLRPALHDIAARDDAVRVVLHHVEPPMRPREVHLVMRSLHRGELAEPVLITRVAQGRPIKGGLVEALSGHVTPLRTEQSSQKVNTP